MVTPCGTCKRGGELGFMASCYEEYAAANRLSTDASLDDTNYLGLEVDVLAQQEPAADPERQAFVDDTRGDLAEVRARYTGYFRAVEKLLSSALVAAQKVDCGQHLPDQCPRYEALVATETEFVRLTADLEQVTGESRPTGFNGLNP